MSWITWQNRQADLHLEPQAETLVLSQLVWDIERFLAHLQHLDAGPFEAGSEASARPMPTSVRAPARQLWHTGLGSVTQRQAVGEQVGGLPAKNVHPLTYGGQVLHVDQKHVYQFGPKGIVQHDRKLFEKEPVVGKCYEVSYSRGVGKVKAELSQEEGAKLQAKKAHTL